MAIARGQITIVDLNDGRSINLYLSANHPTTQIFTQGTANTGTGGANGAYTPNWEEKNADGQTFKNPLVITPIMYVSGLEGDRVTSDVESVEWLIEGKTPTNFGNATVANKANHYALTITRNMRDLSQMTIKCTAKFKDPDTETSVYAIADITFTKVNNAGDSITAVVYAKDGNTISRNEVGAIQHVTLHCDMWRGSAKDEDKVAFQWKKMNASGQFVNITPKANELVVGGTNASGVSTPNLGNELTVYASAVDNFEIFQCECKDTDDKSPTYNNIALDCITVNDITDPYSVEISCPSGTVLTRGNDYTIATAQLWQDGKLVSQRTGITYQWAAYDKNATEITSLGDKYDINGLDKANNPAASLTTRLVTNASSLRIHKDMVNVRTTFICTVTIQ